MSITVFLIYGHVPIFSITTSIIMGDLPPGDVTGSNSETLIPRKR